MATCKAKPLGFPLSSRDQISSQLNSKGSKRNASFTTMFSLYWCAVIPISLLKAWYFLLEWSGKFPVWIISELGWLIYEKGTKYKLHIYSERRTGIAIWRFRYRKEMMRPRTENWKVRTQSSKIPSVKEEVVWPSCQPRFVGDDHSPRSSSWQATLEEML